MEFSTVLAPVGLLPRAAPAGQEVLRVTSRATRHRFPNMPRVVGDDRWTWYKGKPVDKVCGADLHTLTQREVRLLGAASVSVYRLLERRRGQAASWLDINVGDVADELDMGYRTAGRALARLDDCGALVRSWGNVRTGVHLTRTRVTVRVWGTYDVRGGILRLLLPRAPFLTWAKEQPGLWNGAPCENYPDEIPPGPAYTPGPLPRLRKGEAIVENCEFTPEQKASSKERKRKAHNTRRREAYARDRKLAIESGRLSLQSVTKNGPKYLIPDPPSSLYGSVAPEELHEDAQHPRPTFFIYSSKLKVPAESHFSFPSEKEKRRRENAASLPPAGKEGGNIAPHPTPPTSAPLESQLSPHFDGSFPTGTDAMRPDRPNSPVAETLAPAESGEPPDPVDALLALVEATDVVHPPSPYDRRLPSDFKLPPMTAMRKIYKGYFPLHDHMSDYQKARACISGYRIAIKECWPKTNPRPMGRDWITRHLQKFVEGADVLVDGDLPAEAWALWVMRRAKQKGNKRPPSIFMVFAPGLIRKQRGWFRDKSDDLPSFYFEVTRAHESQYWRREEARARARGREGLNALLGSPTWYAKGRKKEIEMGYDDPLTNYPSIRAPHNSSAR